MDLGPLVQCRFLDRPNRFLAHVEHRGRRVPCFLANPGRLRELLLPGAPALIRRVPPRDLPASPKIPRLLRNPGERRTRHDLVAVQAPDGEWVCIDTRVPNRLFRLHRHHWAPFSGAREWRSEYTHGFRGLTSRFDFAYSRGPRRGLVEVKCVTLVRDGVALFPDAPTQRGARHLEHLARARRRGWETHAVFLVFRRASRLEPHGEMDPGFARALHRARRAGVCLHAYRFTLDGSRMECRGRLPVVFP